MENKYTKKTSHYKELGFDAFLYKGPGAVGEKIETLSDISSGKTSALRQSGQTEKVDLGQSGSISIKDGTNTRLFIGNK